MTNNTTKKLVFTALFAAIIFLGTHIFRIELAPKLMVHLGNALVVISFIALGTKHSMLAASVGFAIFDITHGYLSSVHFTILESLIVVALLGVLHQKLRYSDSIGSIFSLSILAGITKIIVIFMRRYITALLVGTASPFVTTLLAMTNTFITSTITIFIVPVLYVTLKKYVPQLFTFQHKH